MFFKAILFKCASAQVRCKVIEKTSATHGSPGAELVWKALNDRDPRVRCAAVRAFEKSPVADCIGALVSVLDDPEAHVRTTAARALGRRGDQSATGALVMRLGDPSPEVRAAAATALRQLGWRPSTQEEAARFDIAQGNTTAAVYAGAAALQVLAEELNQETSFQRRAAAEALSQVQDPGRVGPLLKALNDADPSVRVSAAHALACDQAEIVTAELLKLFHDSDPHVRLASAQVLATRADAPPAHFLPLLSDENLEIRLAAVQFLGQIHHPEISLALLPMLSDPDHDVRQATANAMGEMRCVEAIEELVVSMGDTEQVVRAAAENALESIDPDWPRTDAAQRAAGRLQALIESRPGWVYSAIARVLERLATANAEPAHAVPGDAGASGVAGLESVQPVD